MTSPRKRNKTQPPDPAQVIKANNAVGRIQAGEHANVKVTQHYQQNIYTRLSKDEEEHRKQQSELKQLKAAVRQKFSDWKKLVDAHRSANGNHNKFMQPFGFSDQHRFFGRDQILDELLNHLRGYSVTFMDGSGKTSILQAGVVPKILNENHLPLLIHVSSEPLALSLKKQLLPNIKAMEFLDSMSMAEFVRRVADELNNDRQLILLIDGFEAFFDQPTTYQQSFKNDWELCVSGIAPEVHWLFSVPTGSTYLLNLFKEKVAINPNLITIPPLGREAARQAIEGQANLSDIQIDQSVVDAILDTLGMPGIDPTQLELVCYMLAGGKGPIVKHWTFQHYTNLGEADGILRGYLENTINELDPVERGPAWQLLATLIDSSGRIETEAELIRKMKSLDIDEEIARRVLEDLEDRHLVEYATAYKLSSNSLLPRIQEWQDKRDALEKAKEEVWRQVRSIGGSALRGLIGGAIGFALAYWALPYVERVPITKTSLFFQWYFYNLTLRALVGAAAGFIMILGVDLIFASFKGNRRWMRLPAGVLAGACSFALALIFHVNLRYLGNQLPIALSRAGVEGAVWGATAGAACVWTMLSTRQTWLKLLSASVVCGLSLALTDLLWSGLDVNAPFYTVFSTGMIMPLFLIGSALVGKNLTTEGWIK